MHIQHLILKNIIDITTIFYNNCYSWIHWIKKYCFSIADTKLTLC